jgi:Tfp pilus assembly protein PilF
MYEFAAQNLAEAVKADPSSWADTYQLATAYFRLGEKKKAIEIMERAFEIAQGPDCPPAFLEMTRKALETYKIP